MAEYVAALITCGSEDEAQALARTLVRERLAACVNVIPGITSHYWWKGQVQTDAEWLLLAKMPAARAQALTERVQALHSYDVPEVITLPISGGNQAYLDWLEKSTAGGA